MVSPHQFRNFRTLFLLLFHYILPLVSLLSSFSSFFCLTLENVTLIDTISSCSRQQTKALTNTVWWCTGEDQNSLKEREC